MADATSSKAGSYQISGVSEAAFELARAFFAGGGITGIDGDSGTASGAATTVNYRYDRNSGTVSIEVDQYPASLEGLPVRIASAALMKTLERAFSDPTGSEFTTLEGRHPNKYGVYDYVIPNLTNNTGVDLQFSTQDMNHGTLASHAGTIAAGATAELFEADSTKLSGLGVGGTVVFQLVDGTPLSIDFFLNTIYTHTFTAGFTGGNAGRYQPPTVTEDSPVLSGYTYLTPTITIAKK